MAPKIFGPQIGGEFDGDLGVNQWIIGTIPKNQQQKHIQVFQNHLRWHFSVFTHL